MNPLNRDFTVGALTFRVDGGTGMLRHLRFGGHEVLRGIYPAVRTERWETLAAAVAPMTVRGEPGALWIEFDAHVAAGGVELRWRAEIEADARGLVQYRWRAHADSAFKTNRTGLCVLHPAEAAGQPCRIEQADGRTLAGWFPASVSPHQPFREIRAITHLFAPGAEATVRMEGEVFEMEDQRNWSDASFKTYCRPLDWPRPYTVARGQVIEHTITVNVAGVPPRAPAATPELQLLASSMPPLPLPRIGFGLTGPLSPALRDRVRALRPAHLRVATTARELDETLNWACPETGAIGCELELAIRGATADPPSPARIPIGTAVLLFDAD
jgi:D-apionolactonase